MTSLDEYTVLSSGVRNLNYVRPILVSGRSVWTKVLSKFLKNFCKKGFLDEYKWCCFVVRLIYYELTHVKRVLYKSFFTPESQDLDFSLRYKIVDSLERELRRLGSKGGTFKRTLMDGTSQQHF